MRKMFTQNFGRQYLTLALVAFGCFAMTAQMTLEITGPAGLARTYEIGIGQYGTTGFPEVSGSLAITEDGTALPNEGCNPITNDIVGKIAVSDRGTCNFSLKAYNAQLAGAVGAILCNVNDEALNMPAGVNATDVTIPHVMLSSSDCQSIKAVMAGEDVTARIYYANWGFDDVLWGDAPDGGDFDQDFSVSGWTTVGVSDTAAKWTHGEIPITDGSCGSFYIQSPTAFNGAALMDSDFILSGGSAFPCGTGSAQLTSELISPVIDCSSFTEIAIRFWQFNLPIGINENENENGTTVSWSLDGGTTYQNAAYVPTTSEQNTGNSQYSNAEKFELVVPELAGSENVVIKLTFDRSRGLYNWLVDDFALIRPSDYDVVLEGSFYTPLSFATPVNHLSTDEFGFSANLWNAGVKDDVEIVTTVRILDEDDVEVHMEEDSRTIPALTRDTVTFTTINPDYTQGNYRITYETGFAGGVMDEIPANNNAEYPFVVTDDIFGKEYAAEADLSGFTTAANDPWYYGPFYTISSAASDVDRGFVGVQMATGATDGTLDDETFALYLLKWEDPNDGYPQFTNELNMPNITPLDHPFMTIVAFASVNPTGLANNALFNLNVEDGAWFDESGGVLSSFTFEAGATYAILGEFNGAAIGLSSVNGPNLPGSPGVLQNYNGGGEYFTGFTNSYPVLRLQVSGFTANEDIELSEAQANVYPTLTSDVINIELNFTESTETHIMITDMNGRVQSFNKFDNISQHSYTQDLSDMAEGMYIVNIETALGTKEIPVTVVK